ncbi:MAG: hypothetical protein HOY71_23765, partial [Nonomuraea sp.]|nr:hypothetical protein [Nonomuraea sp.]
MTASAQYRLSRAFGNPATSVDLFHGELDLPLRLADRVTARYSSRVAATTWNDDAPTGVLGLGWSLELDRIVLADGAYFHGDVRLEPSGTRDGDLLFQSAREPLWEIRYGTATQSWRITRDDGSQARYRPTMYRTSWGKPRRYPVAWHLSELRAGGETHTWTYESDEVEEPPGLNRTAGVYLTQVAGPHGHARFQYVVTQPFESETRALSRLDVRSGAEAYTLRFLYELRDVSGHGPR